MRRRLRNLVACAALLLAAGIAAASLVPFTISTRCAADYRALRARGGFIQLLNVRNFYLPSAGDAQTGHDWQQLYWERPSELADVMPQVIPYGAWEPSFQFMGFSGGSVPFRVRGDGYIFWDAPAATSTTPRYSFVRFPAVLLVLPALIFVFSWLHRTLRARSREAAGDCPGCGYDVRATPDRCPECGVSIAAGTAA